VCENPHYLQGDFFVPTHYQVQRGDCVLGIAAEFGFTDWNEIWSHPENKDLRARRPDPTVLAEGDVVFVPDPKQQVFVLETGKRAIAS
jgi:hypothetical protein